MKYALMGLARMPLKLNIENKRLIQRKGKVYVALKWGKSVGCVREEYFETFALPFNQYCVRTISTCFELVFTSDAITSTSNIIIRRVDLPLICSLNINKGY